MMELEFELNVDARLCLDRRFIRYNVLRKGLKVGILILDNPYDEMIAERNNMCMYSGEKRCEEMLYEYNPFTAKKIEDTEHGVINYQHDMGTTYVTHRRKEHYFVKYQGFAISNSELEIAYNKRVYWILFMYHKEDGSIIPYRYKLNDVKLLEEYNQEGDIQRVFPIREMETKEEEKWV